MDQKNWLWRKKSSEKKIIANDKADLSVKDNDEEVYIMFLTLLEPSCVKCYWPVDI